MIIPRFISYPRNIANQEAGTNTCYCPLKPTIYLYDIDGSSSNVSDVFFFCLLFVCLCSPNDLTMNDHKDSLR